MQKQPSAQGQSKKELTPTRTRSQPADPDDPYRMQRIEQEMIIKYQQILDDQANKPEAAVVKQQQKQVKALLQGIDPQIDPDLLAEIMAEVKSAHKDI